MQILGIDIGGTGIKGAPVDTETGKLLAPRFRIPTPSPSKPIAVAGVVGKIVKHFDWHAPMGCGFPGVVREGVALTAANIHRSWIETNVADLFARQTNCPVRVLNDADAAGLAEMTFGAGKGRSGTVLVVTLGTGIGSALFSGGLLLPNTEFGHLRIRGKDAERRASDSVRKLEDLSWKDWAKRLDEYLGAMQALVWPDLIILGGGAVKYYERFAHRLTVRAEVAPALLGNEAGIVGAALAALAVL
ncbi:MAG: ROK family protein [Anaerolineales bacterium]